MGKFSDAARDSFNRSRITTGREKVSMDDILVDYPDGITIIDFDMISGDDGKYPAIAFKEDQKAFFFGGTVLTRICNSWLDLFDGDVESCVADLQHDGGVKIRIFRDKNQKGKMFYNAEVVE